MMRAFRYIATLCLLLIAAGSYAQGGDAIASLRADATKMLVGDQARVFLSAQCDSTKARIQWPQVPDSFGKLEVVEKGKIDTVKKGILTIYTQRLLVSGWDSAEYAIPAFQFNVTPTNGAPYTIQTEGLSFSVSTVSVDTTKPFKPIKGIMEVETSWMDYIWWFVGAGLLLLALIAYIIWRNTRKRPVIVAPPPPPEPVHEKALRLLSELEAENLWQKGEVKEYYVRLTDILRNYVEDRFDVPALERTTDELTAAASHHKELAFQAQRLHIILATADMAKFARAQPTPTEHISTMQATRELIMATIPQPPTLQQSNAPTVQHPNPEPPAL
jgi:hypothetical protein